MPPSPSPLLDKGQCVILKVQCFGSFLKGKTPSFPQFSEVKKKIGFYRQWKTSYNVGLPCIYLSQQHHFFYIMFFFFNSGQSPKRSNHPFRNNIWRTVSCLDFIKLVILSNLLFSYGNEKHASPLRFFPELHFVLNNGFSQWHYRNIRSDQNTKDSLSFQL